MAAYEDLTGQVFGRYTVLQESEKKDSRNRRLWEVQCSCGSAVRVLRADSLKTGAAKSCGCLNRELVSALNGESNYRWRGHGEISGTHWSRIRLQAKERGLEFNLTIEEAYELFLAQGKTCALSGVGIVFGERYKEETTASLDRMDSSLGYFLSNVQWVHKELNRLKWDVPNSEFIAWAKLIAAKHASVSIGGEVQ